MYDLMKRVISLDRVYVKIGLKNNLEEMFTTFMRRFLVYSWFSMKTESMNQEIEKLI